MGQPLPEATAMTIRDTFGRANFYFFFEKTFSTFIYCRKRESSLGCRPLLFHVHISDSDCRAGMGMNDSETVALIGGGHAFGKAHGACPAGPGKPPNVDPKNPWAGNCGTGKGADTFTSGFEGPWTTNPTKFDNSYFHNLVDNGWEVHTGLGGHKQWRIQNGNGRDSAGRSTHRATSRVPNSTAAEEIMMLTSDVSLTKDSEYFALVTEYAKSQSKFSEMFAYAWYKLTSRDMGPHVRCAGSKVPPPQPWQHELPPPVPVSDLPDFKKVASDIAVVIHTAYLPAMPPDVYDGAPTYGPLFVRLAFACASTFRKSDYRGGCNGARIRFLPERQWKANKALDSALEVLAPIKRKYGDGLSWADLIVLAGGVGLEAAGAKPMVFCGGRSDALDGAGSVDLEPRVSGDVSDRSVQTKDYLRLTGLTVEESTVLIGGGHTLGQMHEERSGHFGSWTDRPTAFDNSYFKNLMEETWELVPANGTRKAQYKAKGKDIFMLETDIFLREDREASQIAQRYATDNSKFLSDFAGPSPSTPLSFFSTDSAVHQMRFFFLYPVLPNGEHKVVHSPVCLIAAWSKIMNADRFTARGDNPICFDVSRLQ